jgi:hypothetical protein
VTGPTGGTPNLQQVLDAGNSATGANATITLNDTDPGGGSNPMLTLNQNDTNAGAGSIRMFKNISTNGSAIGEVSFVAKTAITGNPEREYARIDARIRNNNTSNIDGSIGLSARVNDVLTEIVRVNGVDNQTEFLQPIDMNGNAINCSTGNLAINCAVGDITTTSTAGDINLVVPGAGKSINLTASAGSIALTASTDNLVLRGGTLAQLEGTGTNANVIIKPETTGGDLVLEGANIESNTSGPASTQYLRIKLNGIYYKIQLYADTTPP